MPKTYDLHAVSISVNNHTYTPEEYMNAMTGTVTSYATRSGAHRGAKRAGLTSGAYTIETVVEDGATRFVYNAKPEEVEAPEAPEAPEVITVPEPVVEHSDENFRSPSRQPSETMEDYRSRRNINDYIDKRMLRGRIIKRGKGFRSGGVLYANNRAERRHPKKPEAGTPGAFGNNKAAMAAVRESKLAAESSN